MLGPMLEARGSAELPLLPMAEKRSHVRESNVQLPLDANCSAVDNDDDRVATENEVRDLLHVVDRIPGRLWIACLAGILECFVWYGATTPLQNYLQNKPGGEDPGALGLQQAAASNIVNALMIGSYIILVPAVVIADSWLGRYKTMLYAAMYWPCYDSPLAYPATHDGTMPNQISVFLQIPIYFGGSLTEVFCLITGTEYAYNNAPEKMKTLVQAIWLAMAGIGSCLALAFTPLTQDPYLVVMYAILAGILAGATVLL
ncbi:hypothetical protein F4804DRAFT_353698 [Jackrogersella minutella]|nr:hypothetical protein F4804DRAFT_353698 [Jackrogersella minutella]